MTEYLKTWCECQGCRHRLGDLEAGYECYHGNTEKQTCFEPQKAEASGSNSTKLLARELCRVHTVAYEKGYLDGGGREQSSPREIEAIIDGGWEEWQHVAEAIAKQTC